ncbi:MAG: FAD-dependent oxidoreductase, partial [Lentisphaeria bacterium]|nr:FAD-dependent oxidoreductase [Lentisphaeria bacterium]
PAGLEGILVTGLGVSAHRDAIPVIRMQPCVQNQGYAAGAIAARAASSGGAVRNVDLGPIQKDLLDRKCLTPDAFDRKDEFPLPRERVAAAVRDVGKGHRELAVILSHAETALPLLRQAYAEATSAEAKLTYAHICAMLHDPTGAETLAAAVAGVPVFDKGWNYRGMGQFGMSISALDSYLIALGRTRQPGVLDILLDKAALLEAQSEFSHHRAVAMALEALAWPESALAAADRGRAARALAELLAKPGMGGYATPTVDASRGQIDGNPTSTTPRNDSLRELVLARALYRCGDHEGRGEAILRQYAADLRGHYRRHARAVLGEDR